MKFDGTNFRKAPMVCLLSIPNPDPKCEGYAAFGHILPQGMDAPASAHQVGHSTWPNGASVFALVIPSDGYSLTNKMYGKDGKTYLAKDGVCYVAPGKIKDLTRDAVMAQLPPWTPTKYYSLKKKRSGDCLIIESTGAGFGFCVGKGLTWRAALADYQHGLTADFGASAPEAP